VTRGSRERFSVLLIVAFAAAAGPAAAQTAPASSGLPIEVSVQAAWVGPASFGSVNENLTRPAGSPYPVFQTDNSLGSGIGVEANFGYPLGARLQAELTGAWSRASLRSEITGDVEDADDITITETLNRFSIEGGVLWTLRTRERSSIFIRGSGGWMRELAGSGALAEDGFVANAGAGMKYWWGTATPGQAKRIGLRVEGRLSIRSGGITLGERSVRVAPVASGGLIFRF
jgi:hypothetical protein